MKTIVLYGRPRCHLCDLARKVLEQAAVPFDYQDISDNIELLDRYRERIPVVAAGEVELGWPFDAQILMDWYLGLTP